jgi:hypothetical protein
LSTPQLGLRRGLFKAQLDFSQVLRLPMSFRPSENTSNHARGPSRKWKEDVEPDDPVFEDARIDDLIIVSVISIPAHSHYAHVLEASRA